MAPRRQKRFVAIGMASIGLLVGVVVVMRLVEPPHPGKAHYQAYCGECHKRDGVLAIIEQQSRDAE